MWLVLPPKLSPSQGVSGLEKGHGCGSPELCSHSRILSATELSG